MSSFSSIIDGVILEPVVIDHAHRDDFAKTHNTGLFTPFSCFMFENRYPHRMVLLACQVIIESELCLEDVAAIISEHLLGGVSFIGKEECVRDELPAVYTARYILGCRFLLSGERDSNNYYLEVMHHKPMDAVTEQQTRESLVDISSDIVDMLRDVGSIRASLPG